MISTTSIVTEFSELIKKKISTGRLHLNYDVVLVVSIRPRMKFTNSVIWNTEYNTEYNMRKDDRESRMKKTLPTREVTERIARRIPRSVDRDDNKFHDFVNYYEVLMGLEDECAYFNTCTNSDITVPLCVKKICSIQNEKEVEKMDLNKIISEHKREIKKLTQNVVQTQVNLDIMPIYTKTDTSSIDTKEHDHKLLTLPTQPIVINDILLLNMSRLQTYQDQLKEQVISDYANKLSMKKIIKEIHVSMCQQLIKYNKELQNISDEVNPHKICEMAGHVSPQLDPRSKELFDSIVRPLIIKCNMASQELLNTGKAMNRLIPSIINSVMDNYTNLF